MPAPGQDQDSSKRSALFRERLAAQPRNLLFRFSLGQALWQEGDPAAAIPHLEQCAMERADWLIPRLSLGQIYLALQKPAEARRWLQEALALAQAQGHEDPAAEAQHLLAELPPA